MRKLFLLLRVPFSAFYELCSQFYFSNFHCTGLIHIKTYMSSLWDFDISKYFLLLLCRPFGTLNMSSLLDFDISKYFLLLLCRPSGTLILVNIFCYCYVVPPGL
jgi:hypothetical protein